MTLPGTTTTADTDTAGGTVTASPALGPDPAAPAGDVAATADPDAPTVDAGGPPPATVAVYKDADGRRHYASPFSKAVQDRVAAGKWTEADPADVDEVDEPFDPTTHLVREVVAYLEEHADDADEVRRVKDAEAAGEDRPTIRDWEPAGE